MFWQASLSLMAAAFMTTQTAPSPRGSVSAGDPVAGRSLYQARCGGCHSLDTNRIGPLHRGVVGRQPGSVPGYAYSPRVRALGGTWTPARLDQWLQGPQRMAPGSKMFTTIDNATERRHIIAYLQSVSPPGARR